MFDNEILFYLTPPLGGLKLAAYDTVHYIKHLPYPLRGIETDMVSYLFLKFSTLPPFGGLIHVLYNDLQYFMSKKTNRRSTVRGKSAVFTFMGILMLCDEALLYFMYCGKAHNSWKFSPVQKSRWINRPPCTDLCRKPFRSAVSL